MFFEKRILYKKDEIFFYNYITQCGNNSTQMILKHLCRIVRYSFEVVFNVYQYQNLPLQVEVCDDDRTNHVCDDGSGGNNVFHNIQTLRKLKLRKVVTWFC